MYTEQDWKQANGAWARFLALLGAIVVVLGGAIAAALILRMIWLLYTAAVVLTVVSLFLWGNFGVRIFCWRRFLKDMRTGMQREVTGEIISIDEELSLRDGVEFREVRLMTGEDSDKAGGRVLYIDASRFPLNVSIGARVHIDLFGNYVKGMEQLGLEEAN